MIGLKDVSATETRAAYVELAALSVSLHDGVPQEYAITAPEHLCMTHDEAQHALEHGHAATVTPDVWDALRRVLVRAAAGAVAP